MSAYLKALSLQFYRGIGPAKQAIGPFSEMNLFIGANNSGKSTVLNFIRDRLPFSPGTNPESSLGPAEDYRGEVTGTLKYAVGIPRTEFISRVEARIAENSEKIMLLTMVKKVVDDLSTDGFVWVSAGQGGEYAFEPGYNLEGMEKLLGQSAWHTLSGRLTNLVGAGVGPSITETLRFMLRSQKVAFPAIAHIPAERDLWEAAKGFRIRGDKTLIEELAALQSPDHDRRQDRLVFDKITRFVRVVTGKNDVSIEVPHDRKHLLVHIDNKVLPLFRLGTGIQEVILIAAFCTIHDNMIICIEEPEKHLHPVLQRKLIRYLQASTNNQYFIATHSAAFIDTPEASIFRVENDAVQTRILSAVHRGDQKMICDDLGYRASDILQSNAVVWVEGPSDRIYVRHWLNAIDADLLEGIHYTIMFYGGALVRHLGAKENVDEEHLKEFIDLRALNQNMAIVLDSDKASPRSKLKPAVRRLKADLSTRGGLVWVTKGREIENYVNPELLHEAIKKTHPISYKGPAGIGPYDHSFYFERKKAGRNGSAIQKSADKVNIARLVCEEPADFSQLDLKSQVSSLARFIKMANEL